MIRVTKTFLPPQTEFEAILKKAWDTGWITNRGILVNELEKKLKSYLGVSNMIVTANGTIPLQIAIKAMNLNGEIITTPFSYVASTSSIVWEGCKPVFVDINPDYLTIDETKIEAAITSNTTAILATHVFGNPCDVDEIERIAKKYNLKVIYDAAHCFGVQYNGKSIFEYGDVSTCSFHATKVFHTGEGGAIFTKSKKLKNKLFYHHNFGHHGQEEFHGLGINAKMSELQAALGLSVFPFVQEIIDKRKNIVDYYKNHLQNFVHFQLRDRTKWNYSYFPILFRSEEELLNIKKKLNVNGIYPRRYFYPSLNTLPYVEFKSTPIAESVSSRILCLPLYHSILEEEIKKVVNIIQKYV